VYDYLNKIVGVQESDIIIFGRSMGSGPGCYLSSLRKPCTLLLVSPYTSIKDAVKSFLGWAGFISTIIYERFRNIDLIKYCRCPVFFLHGQADKLIPL